MSARAIRELALKPFRATEVAVPTVLTMLGILIVALTPSQVTAVVDEPVGTRFLPYVTGLIVLIGGVAELVSVILRRRNGITATSGDQIEVSAAKRLTFYAMIVLGILVWVYTTVLIGYLLSSVVLMVLTALAFGLKNPLKFLILIVLSVGVTYFLFAELLNVQLPLLGW